MEPSTSPVPDVHLQKAYNQSRGVNGWVALQSMIMRYVMWKNDAVLDQSQSQFTVSILILDHNTAIVT